MRTRGGTQERGAAGFGHAGFFALRAPLLPAEDHLAWSEGMTGDLDANVALLRDRLRARIERPEVREALFIASPTMWDSLPHWLEDPEGERGQKVERSLVKYLSRMAIRATPFGLFAGTAVGRIGDRTHLTLAPVAEHGRHTRLDGDYLDRLCRALAGTPAIAAGLTLRPSSSLYRAAGRYRLVESRLDGGSRSYHLVALEPDEYLEAAIERARSGARPGEIARHLVELDPDIEPDEAAGYVNELVAAQVLVPDLAPPVTGPDPLADLLAQLSDVPAAQPAAELLGRTRESLAQLDRGGPGAAPERYRAIAAELAALPARVELPRLFQVDLVVSAAEASLSRELVDEVLRAVELARRLMPALPDPLAAFAREFAARYEAREVPLTEVLDEESGIGFGRSSAPSAEAAPLLQGIPFAARLDDTRGARAPGHAHLADRIGRAIARGEDAVELTAEDLEALSARTPAPLPDAFAAMVQLSAASAEAAARGELDIHLLGLNGPSGAGLLGRFCQGDPAMAACVAEHLRAEEALRPDALHAEVVHLPEGRIGNVIFRPVLRGAEIPYLGRSGAPADQQVPLDDLLVSVRGGRVILRSRRLGREIIPRLTTAHNYQSRSLGPYRFLCALQRQSGGPAISLGPLELLPYLPSIRAGRVVLAPARWRVPGRDLAALWPKEGGRAERLAAAAALRERHRLPRRVLLVEHDNTLPVDLENPLSVDAFAHLVRARDHVTLRALTPAPEQAVVTGPGGRFQHELVIPFVRLKPVDAAQDGAADAATPAVAARADVPRELRHFPPGSSWLYAKLYTGTATADQVLCEVVSPLLAELRAAGAIDGWFFLRYGDPDHHLRLRFRGDPARLAGEALPALHRAAAPLLDDARITRVALDTYEREVERYGGPAGVELAEALFAADSDAVLAIHELLGGDEGLDAAWRLTLLGIELLFEDLGLDLEARHAVCAGAHDALAREHGAEGAMRTVLTRAIGDRYRRERAALEALLDPTRQPDSPLWPGVEILRHRSAAIAPVAAALREAEAAGRLTRTVREMAWDLAHMYANRMLRSAARAQEMVLYGLLARLCDARLARSRRGRS